MNAFEEPPLQPQLRVMQLIAASLLLGVPLFLGIVLFLVHGQNQGFGQLPPGDLPTISLVAVVMAVTSVPLAFFVPGVIARGHVTQLAAGPKADRREDVARLLAIRQTAMIVGMAVVEGVAFLACIAYLLEARVFVLAVVGVALGCLLAQFPTEGRVRAWLRAQREQLHSLREWVAREGHPPG
jgi:hypothetical protein